MSLLLSTTARGTSVVAPDFAALVERADLIFTGTVTSQRSEWRRIDGERSIVTLVSFDVASVHKGRASRHVTLQLLGGTIGEVTLEVAAIPRFKTGERAVLFVERNGENISPIVGVFHGRFGLRTDSGTGRDVIFKHDGQPLAAVTDLGRPRTAAKSVRPTQTELRVPSPEPMTHDDFVSKVREHLARSSR